MKRYTFMYMHVCAYMYINIYASHCATAGRVRGDRTTPESFALSEMSPDAHGILSTWCKDGLMEGFCHGYLTTR